MIQFEFNDIAIGGLACCVPENTETLEKYNNIFGKESVDKFIETTGVKERHISLPEQTASDLAYVAASKLLALKNIDKKSVGALIFISQTEDYRLPATAYVLQNRLGLSRDCVCFDINLGCSAYVYGLAVVASIMSNSNIDTGLLLTGDTITKYVSPNDKSVCMLLADAASATLLQKKKPCGRMRMSYQGDGSRYESVIVPAGACRNLNANDDRFIGEDGNMRSNGALFMDGAEIFSFGMTDVPKFINEFMVSVDKTSNDYDALIMHQANLYLMKQIARKTNFAMNKVPISIDHYGNTSGTCIPVTIVDNYAMQCNAMQYNLLLSGFGVGLSLGVADITINSNDILPMLFSDDYYKEGVR